MTLIHCLCYLQKVLLWSFFPLQFLIDLCLLALKVVGISYRHQMMLITCLPFKCSSCLQQYYRFIRQIVCYICPTCQAVLLRLIFCSSSPFEDNCFFPLYTVCFAEGWWLTRGHPFHVCSWTSKFENSLSLCSCFPADHFARFLQELTCLLNKFVWSLQFILVLGLYLSLQVHCFLHMGDCYFVT
jgi:hypothetical protein